MRLCAEDVDEPLHPGLFACRGILLDDAFAGSRVDLLDHVLECGCCEILVLGMGGGDYALGRGTHAALYFLVLDASLLVLLVPLLCG